MESVHCHDNKLEFVIALLLCSFHDDESHIVYYCSASFICGRAHSCRDYISKYIFKDGGTAFKGSKLAKFDHVRGNFCLLRVFTGRYRLLKQYVYCTPCHEYIVGCPVQ